MSGVKFELTLLGYHKVILGFCFCFFFNSFLVWDILFWCINQTNRVYATKSITFFLVCLLYKYVKPLQNEKRSLVVRAVKVRKSVIYNHLITIFLRNQINMFEAVISYFQHINFNLSLKWLACAFFFSTETPWFVCNNSKVDEFIKRRNVNLMSKMWSAFILKNKKKRHTSPVGVHSRVEKESVCERQFDIVK